LCAGFTPAHAPFAAAAASLFTELHNSTALSTPSCPSLFQTTASLFSSPSSITPGAVMLRVFVPILGIATVCVVDTARVQNDHRIIRQSSRIARRPLAFVRVVRVFAPSRDPSRLPALARPRPRVVRSARARRASFANRVSRVRAVAVAVSRVARAARSPSRVRQRVRRTIPSSSPRARVAVVARASRSRRGRIDAPLACLLAVSWALSAHRACEADVMTRARVTSSDNAVGLDGLE
jgi:hypothetical protein